VPVDAQASANFDHIRSSSITGFVIRCENGRDCVAAMQKLSGRGDFFRFSGSPDLRGFGEVKSTKL